FWEDYGYVGAATFLLAIYGAVRERRRPVVGFAIAMTLIAYLFVLGKATPIFRVAYELIPGIKLFRFPTRFLIVVELGIALLGAVGLTRLRLDLRRRWPEPSRVPALIAVALCAGTALDLFVHHPRQNPMVSASEWLAPPPAVAAVQRDTPHPRTFTPKHRDLHRRAFELAQGWTNLRPYFELRNLLQPNIGGGFWNTPSADCYAGIAPRWLVDVWGDHSREDSLVAKLAGHDFEASGLWIKPAFPKFLRTYGVTHVLSPYPQPDTPFQLVAHDGHAFVYKVPGAARVRFVRAARHATTQQATAKRLLEDSFDPDREVLLHDAPATIHPTVDQLGDRPPLATPPRAVVVLEDARHVLIDVEAPEDGFLLLADTFYPGWIAKVDRVRTPIYRANGMLRAVQLPKGRHAVRFTYQAPTWIRGMRISLVALVLLLLWTIAAAVVLRRRSTRPAAARGTAARG
ncbi:MAG TPA: hypothetical protein VK509_03815, partial [Polyangiales bacterium]|nr:hypothetical protein [Polyangiales bacterium]